MTTLLWLPPLIRALTTALLVTTASAAAEALGPFWGALIASLPVSAGPAYVFLAMDHGANFVAASALSSFAANAATGVFLTLYGMLAGHRSPWQSLGLAILGWLGSSLALHQFSWSPVTALFLNGVAYGAGLLLLDRVALPGSTAMSGQVRRWMDMPLRALAVAAFVSLVVAGSSALGPGATGIVAVFPVSLISLLVIVRPRIGGAASALLAVNALRSMFGFGLMLLAFHAVIRSGGMRAAFIVALLVSATWSAGLLLLKRKG